MATNPIDAGSARTEKAGTRKRRIRKVFGNIHEVVQMPNLIEVQRESYEQFLRSDTSIGYVSGLEKTLRSVFPIRDFAGTAELDWTTGLDPAKPGTGRGVRFTVEAVVAGPAIPLTARAPVSR